MDFDLLPMHARVGTARLLRIGIVIATVAVIGSCQLDTSQPADDSYRASASAVDGPNVVFYLTDFPINNQEVIGVHVTFEAIEVHSETAGWMTVADYAESGGRAFDLLTLQNGTTAELGAFDLEPGTYSQMRLHLRGDNQIELATDSGSIREPLRIPSGEQTGIKLIHPFTVVEDGVTSVTLDFDAEASVRHNRGQGYRLKPTIRVIDATTTPVASACEAGGRQAQAPILGDGIYECELQGNHTWLAFDLGVGTQLTVSISPLPGGNLELFDDDGNQAKATVTPTAEGQTLTWSAVTEGTYYLDISVHGGAGIVAVDVTTTS